MMRREIERETEKERKRAGLPDRNGFFGKRSDGVIIEYKNLDEVINALKSNTLGNFFVPKDAKQPEHFINQVESGSRPHAVRP